MIFKWIFRKDHKPQQLLRVGRGIWALVVGAALLTPTHAQNWPASSQPEPTDLRPGKLGPRGQEMFGISENSEKKVPRIRQAGSPEAGLKDWLAPHPLDLPADGPPLEAPVITAVALDRAGRLFATAGDDHLIRLWELPEGRLLHRLKVHEGWVRTVAFSPDGQHLATAGDDRQVILFQVGQPKPIWRVELGVALYALAFSPDGRYVVAAGFSDKIWWLETTTGKRSGQWRAAGQDVRALAFSPDGSQLAAGSRNGLIRLWDTASGVRQGDLQAHQRRVRSVAYSPDGQWLVSGGEDGRVVLWDPKGERNLRLLAQLPGAVYCLIFCGADRLGIGTTANRIEVVRISDGQVLRQLAGHTGTVAALAWESSSQTLISGGFDTTVRFWSLGPGSAGPWTHQPPPSSKPPSVWPARSVSPIGIVPGTSAPGGLPPFLHPDFPEPMGLRQQH